MASKGIKDRVAIIGITELGEPNDRPRLTLNISNRNAFQSLVVQRCNEQTLEARRDAAR